MVGLGSATLAQSRLRIGVDLKSIAIWCLLAGIALSGVLIDPRAPERISKLILADAFFVCGAALFVVASTSRDGVVSIAFNASARQPAALLAAFLLWVLASGVVAILFHGAAFGSVVQTLSNYVYGAVIFTVIVAASASTRTLSRFAHAYLFGVVIVAGISVLAMFGMGPDWAHHGAGRIKSTTQSVNQLAAHVAPAIPLALILCMRRRTSKLLTLVYLGIVGLSILALIATGSRTALALTLISVVPVCLAYGLFFRQNRLMAGAGALIVALACIGFANLILIYLRYGAGALPDELQILARPFDMVFGQTAAIQGLGPRVDQFMIVWQNWFETPVFGVGPGNFKSYFSYYHEVHNTYFGTLIELGIPGLALLLAFIAAILMRAFSQTIAARHSQEAVLLWALGAAFLVVAVYGMGSFGLRQRPFWILAGLAVGALNRPFPNQRAIR